jgi:hydrogenase expression/formation protein HypE
MAKFAPAALESYIFSRTGAENDDLLVGGGYAEDAAAIDPGDRPLVVNTDPISFAADRIGTLGVAIASNDVAACGGTPEWLVSTIFVPSADLDVLDDVTAQLDAEATRLGITIIGGHTETVPALPRPMLSLTCLGSTDRYVPTGGAEPGDVVLLTKGAGIEATAILATDFRESLRETGVEAAMLDRGETFFEAISVVPEATVLAPVATSMHDPTEGGVLNGLVECACASDVRISLDATDVSVKEPTRRLCAAAGVDPLRVFGSGALLATVPADRAASTLEALEAEDIDATALATVESAAGEPGVVLDGQRFTGGVDDDLYALWE